MKRDGNVLVIVLVLIVAGAILVSVMGGREKVRANGLKASLKGLWEGTNAAQEAEQCRTNVAVSH